LFLSPFLLSTDLRFLAPYHVLDGRPKHGMATFLKKLPQEQGKKITKKKKKEKIINN